MANRSYNVSDHERAFQVWYDVGTYMAACNETGIDYATVRKWAGPYQCKWSCPWHNWDALKEERTRAIQAQMKLYDQAVLDPAAHDEAIRNAVEQSRNGISPATSSGSLADRQAAVAKICRSDVERLTHWEYLYTKVFFEITGLALDSRLLVRDGQPVTSEELREKLGKGVSCRTLDAGIKALALVQQQIQVMKENLGVYSGKAAPPPSEDFQDEPDEKATKKRVLSLDDVRKFRELLQNTPPEHQELLLKLYQSEEVAFGGLAETTAKDTSYIEVRPPQPAPPALLPPMPAQVLVPPPPAPAEVVG